MTEKTGSLPILLTAAQIAERITSVHARTLKRAQAAGKIKGRMHGGKWLFETASVLQWLGGAPSGPALPIKRPRGRPPKNRQEMAR